MTSRANRKRAIRENHELTERKPGLWLRIVKQFRWIRDKLGWLVWRGWFRWAFERRLDNYPRFWIFIKEVVPIALLLVAAAVGYFQFWYPNVYLPSKAPPAFTVSDTLKEVGRKKGYVDRKSVV